MTKKDMNQIQICFSLAYSKYDTKDKYTLNMLSNIGGGMSSRLFIELREKTGDGLLSIDVDTCYFKHMVYLQYILQLMIKGYFRMVIKLIGLKVIYDAVQKLKTEKITDIELKKQKTYIQGQSLIKFNDIDTLANYYVVMNFSA